VRHPPLLLEALHGYFEGFVVADLDYGHCVFISYARRTGVLKLRFALQWLVALSLPPCRNQLFQRDSREGKKLWKLANFGAFPPKI
jgi:hypothetical protein